MDAALAHLTPEQRRIAAERAGELGGFGVEHLPRRVYEEICLRAKLYTVRFHDDKDEQKSKTIMARARPKHEDYRAAMETGLEAPVTFSQMQCRNFIMAIINFKKKALSPLNDKVFQISALKNRPLGHWRNNEILAKVGKTFGVKSLVFNKIMIYLIGRADVDRE